MTRPPSDRSFNLCTKLLTKADIATLLTLSPTAQRLYWYLKSFANMGEGRTVTHSVGIEQLKQLLLNDAALYPIYTEFARRVLEPIRLEFHAPTKLITASFSVIFKSELGPLKEIFWVSKPK